MKSTALVLLANGFGLWSMINVYLRYQDQMDDQLKADFKWLFTGNTSWFGSTGNLSFLIPLNLYLTGNTWDPPAFSGTTPAERLAKFKSAILAKTKVAVTTVKVPPPPPAPTKDQRPAAPAGPSQVAKGIYMDRFGAKLKRLPQKQGEFSLSAGSWEILLNHAKELK